MEIKQLFDSNKDIYRTIEKVITYSASQEQRLKAEISEYVVTESIEEQFEKLLGKMQAAMEAGGENEVGVWVSGFYGSGKSSFTKYLGLAFDESVTIDGTPFIQHLQNRFKKQTTKQLLSTVAKRFPAAVVMLDLASTQLADASMKEVSTVLYYKILEWAGYSQNLKVAAFERRLKKEGRYEEFLNVFADQLGGEQWANYRNDPLVVDSVVPEIAHQMYPNFFKTPESFSTVTEDWVVFTDQQVEEMLEIAREATGKEYIIFIVDEVGQYVGSRQNLILNLDGLAKNLKNIGDGKVWIVGTAQQTLTEDDPKASLNSPELYKLKDRFPIQIDLEANDIKEICYSRLLGKSPSGETELGNLFDKHGQALRHNTKLVDARAYGADFDKQTFINLYPFLPAHFDILLHLLGALAKSTGGIGLRSAIKVIQDVLVEGADHSTPIANQPVGWLATTVTLFDALKKDIEKGYLSLYQSVGKVKIRFPDSKLHQDIAKTVCVLQILGNLPISIQNVTSLMHGGVADASAADQVKKAVEELISDAIVPLGEQDGNLCFHSEKLNDIEQERGTIPLRAVELRRIQNETLREAYSPLPSTHLNGTLSVQTGLKAQTSGGVPASLSGERNTVQTVVELVDPTDYEAAKARLTEESRHKSANYTIFLFGRTSPEMEELTAEIYRSKEIVNKYRNEPDQEVKEYCNGQTDRANRLMGEVERLIKRSLVQGSFIFRGEVTAVESINQDLIEAARKHLASVAEQVFDRYNEAPVRAVTDLAEKFLRLGNLSGVTNATDPLSLVQTQGDRPSINTGHKAITSIRDMIERQGSIEGKCLIDLFTDAPYGWSQDTLRYLVAAMLVAGEIKLKVAGREVTVNGQQAIDALKTNNAFKSVGVSLREERPSNEILAKAAERLTELSGDMVVPLEDDISKATTKLFPQLQHQYGPLAEKLKGLKLPGSDRLESLSQDIKDILFTDASDAPKRLGGEESELYANLKWAADLKRALEQGLEQTLGELQQHRRELESLPASGTPGQLKTELQDEIAGLNERLNHADFFKHSTEFAGSLTTLKSRVRDTAIALQTEQQQRITDAEQDLRRLSEWPELTQQEQNNLLADLERLAVTASEDLAGLRLLVNQEYAIQSQVQDIKQRIQRIGQQRLQDKLREEQERAIAEGKKKISRTLNPKAQITSLAELDALIAELQQLRGELKYAHEFELVIGLSDNDDPQES
ncbi:MAG: BREX system P-loop protein BrxC [Candidatus Thiodiazotropha endolucinida]|nr:BREX system P-loop protein BrxC [Candidatus Thiodiazotropha taylori]MCG8092898.1 BREX system P-loop protein BrxC [Candidatus Thiodiazotropha endolucinida]MCW4266581.1 BREX system P-loop protein BrxC [Candidatus Thiodiazotropha endolucinida]